MTEFVKKITVPPDHPSLPGHFPGSPIVPGVLLLDLILAAIRDELRHDVRLIAIPSAKFLRPITPNEIVDVTVRIISEAERAQTMRARFRASVTGSAAAEGSFLLETAELGASD